MNRRDVVLTKWEDRFETIGICRKSWLRRRDGDESVPPLFTGASAQLIDREKRRCRKCAICQRQSTRKSPSPPTPSAGPFPASLKRRACVACTAAKAKCSPHATSHPICYRMPSPGEALRLPPSSRAPTTPAKCAGRVPDWSSQQFTGPGK